MDLVAPPTCACLQPPREKEKKRMATCSNCGNSSHCDGVLTKTLKELRPFREFPEDVGNQNIEVCKDCSCDDCSE